MPYEVQMPCDAAYAALRESDILITPFTKDDFIAFMLMTFTPMRASLLRRFESISSCFILHLFASMICFRYDLIADFSSIYISASADMIFLLYLRHFYVVSTFFLLACSCYTPIYDFCYLFV
jgi:hypothetical protein